MMNVSEKFTQKREGWFRCGCEMTFAALREAHKGRHGRLDGQMKL
jgi:hypothetical protein